MKNIEDYLSTAQLSEATERTQSTIRYHFKKGHLPGSFKITPRCRMFPKESIEIIKGMKHGPDKKK